MAATVVVLLACVLEVVSMPHIYGDLTALGTLARCSVRAQYPSFTFTAVTSHVLVGCGTYGMCALIVTVSSQHVTEQPGTESVEVTAFSSVLTIRLAALFACCCARPYRRTDRFRGSS
jgi:hypothetical protein